LSRRRFVSASFAVASACAHSMAIWLEAISVEWMLQVTRTIAFPSRASRSPSASESPRGSASRFAVCLIRSLFRMFSSEEMTAMTISSPSVVLPRTSTSTRGEAASRARR